MKSIICDIDDTLAYAKYRVELKKVISKTEIPPLITLPYIKWTYEMLKSLIKSGYHIYFVTVRITKCNNDTHEWLEKIWFNKKDYTLISNDLQLQKINGDNYDMDWNRMKSYNVKSDLYDIHLDDKDISFVLEDNESCVTMWRYDKWLLCFQVNKDIAVNLVTKIKKKH